jgi:hypothetical protein
LGNETLKFRTVLSPGLKTGPSTVGVVVPSFKRRVR